MLESDAWPLIGRTTELDLISRTITKSGPGVVVTGAMGVGKSRLVRDAVATCGRATVHWTAGSPAARAIPFGPFVNWLPADIHDPVQATQRVIAGLTGGAGQCVVGVDDAHLLDDTSAFMLQQLIDRRLAHVVLTVCNGVAVSDAVAGLWRGGPLRRIDLQPLAHADYLKLLESALGGPLDPVSERRLWHLTRGNVRFTRHIVEQELSASRLRCNDGIWKWQPGATLPSPVCELIEHQMGELPEAIAEVVDVLSVAEPLTSQVLIDIVGAGPLEEAEKRSLIAFDGCDDPVVRLAHPLYGEVRRAKAGHIRLRRLRGTVVSRLDPSDDPRLVLRRGALLLDSDAPSTAEDMLRAAEAALWRGDSGLAMRFAQAAMSAGSGWRASLACAEAFMMAGHLAEAQSVLDVNEISTEAVGPLAVGRATSLYLQRRTEDSHAALLDARSGHEEAGPGTATIDAMAAFLSVCDGDFVAATATADAALAQADLPDCSTMLASTAKTIALGELGRLDSLESTVAPARALGARSAATSFLRFALVDAQCSALQMLGLIGAAEAAIDVLRDDDQPQDVYRWVNIMSGSVSLASGRVDVAVGQLRSALSAQRPGFLGGWLCRYHVDLAIALAIRGESDAAKRCLARLSSLPHPDMAFLETMEMLATAWISASDGAVTRAIAEARNAAATAASRGLPVREVLCLQTATRFGDTTTAPRLNELVDIVDGCRVSAAAAHAAALAAGDGENLMAASLRYEATGDLLSAVDAAAHAGTMFRRVSRRGSALGAARRYMTWLSGAVTCEPRRSPTLLHRRYSRAASVKSSCWQAAA